MKKLEKLTLKEIEENMHVIDKKEATSIIGAANPYSLAYYYLGNHEVAGSGANQDVLDFLKSAGITTTSDETPWCSSFVNYCVNNSGGQGTNSASASSWQSWGTETHSPQVGDVAVANDGSYVGIVDHVNADGTVTIISGNYSDSVMRSDVDPTTYSFRAF